MMEKILIENFPPIFHQNFNGKSVKNQWEIFHQTFPIMLSSPSIFPLFTLFFLFIYNIHFLFHTGKANKFR